MQCRFDDMQILLFLLSLQASRVSLRIFKTVQPISEYPRIFLFTSRLVNHIDLINYILLNASQGNFAVMISVFACLFGGVNSLIGFFGMPSEYQRAEHCSVSASFFSTVDVYT